MLVEGHLQPYHGVECKQNKIPMLKSKIHPMWFCASDVESTLDETLMSNTNRINFKDKTYGNIQKPVDILKVRKVIFYASIRRSSIPRM